METGAAEINVLVIGVNVFSLYAHLFHAVVLSFSVALLLLTNCKQCCDLRRDEMSLCSQQTHTRHFVCGEAIL